MRPSALAALAALAACPIGTAPIDFSGKACSGASDCPTPWVCVGDRCELPDSGLTEVDAGTDAGIDAGLTCIDSPLAGALTLNGGSPIPSSIKALVDVWDHAPALIGASGGRPYETPTFQAPTDFSGTFSLTDLLPGNTYWVAGQIDLPGNQGATDLVHNALSAPLPVVAGDGRACNLAIDVSTLQRCEVVTGFSGGLTTGAYLLDTVVDVPDVILDQELQGNVVAQVTVPSSDGGIETILTLSLQNDPTLIDAGLELGGADDGGGTGNGPLIYAATPTPPFAVESLVDMVNASAGAYAFSVVATDYSPGTCTVSVNPQTSQPTLDSSITSGTRQWIDGGYQLTWMSAADFGATEPGMIHYYDVAILGTVEGNTFVATWASPQLPISTSFQSYTAPPGSCPSGVQCVALVFSARDVLTSLGANPLLESLEYSIAIAELPAAP